MRIRDLFVSDVTRDIPPVVYFHEQSPEKLAAEAAEYIFTGGWPEDHPNHRRVPSGIHEQYVRLLTNIATELDRSGGPDLPTAWISGFYGSGKSIFAKLLGLALDGVALPDGSSLAEAWLKRDTSPKAADLREAWHRLRQKVEPLAVVFDIGGVARDNEHVHSVAVRQVQRRLGYCTTEPLVADFELKLERDGEWSRFEQIARTELGMPWSEVKDNALAEEEFSRLMSVMNPELYTDPMSWFTSRGGTHARAESPEEAVAAIRDMLAFRRPDATLFLVVDEVSQYVLSHKDRVDRLRVRLCTREQPAWQGVAARARPAEARRGGRRLVSQLGEGSLPAKAPRAPGRDQHPRRRPQAAAAEEVGSAAQGALRATPSRPEAVCLWVRDGHPRRVRRGLPHAAGADRPHPPDHQRAPHTFGPGPGRRSGDSRPPAASRRALPRSETGRAASRLARHAGSDLRGAAHRARFRGSGLDGSAPRSVRG